MMDFEKFYKRYLKFADIYLECQFNGDFKKGNHAMRSLVNMDRKFDKDKLLYESMIAAAEKHKHKMVLVELYIYGLRNNYNSDVCLQKLQELKIDSEIGPVSLMIDLILYKEG